MQEKDLYNKLKINNWSELTAEKIPEFVELIPKTKKEISMKALNNFSDWNTLSNELVVHIITIFDKSITETNEGTKESIAAYRLVLERLNEQVQEKNITEERKQVLNEQMIEIAKCIDKKDTENKRNIMEIINTLKTLAIGAGVVLLSMKGIDISNKLKK